MRIRYKAGLGFATMAAAMGVGMMAGKRSESRKGLLDKVKDSLDI